MSTYHPSLVLGLCTLLAGFGGSVAHGKPPKLSTPGVGGGFANGVSVTPTISGNGRFVAYDSVATNLSPLDVSGNFTVFVRDHEKGVTQVASLKDNDSAIAANSTLEGLSKNGRYVLFRSQESGIDPTHSSTNQQAYLRDTKLGTTRNVSLDHTGIAVNGEVTDCAMSPNARFVAFSSAAPFVVAGVSNGNVQVYLHDRSTGAIEIVSLTLAGTPATAACSRPRVSANGRYVFFVTAASNMVDGDNNAVEDIFVRDRDTGTTTIVSKSDSGFLATATKIYEIDEAGKRVAFVSSGAVLLGFPLSSGLYIHDWKKGTLKASFSSPSQLSITSVIDGGFGLSADGSRLAVATFDNLVPSQSGAIYDVYVVNLPTNTAKLVTRDTAGGLTDDNSYYCAISADGKYVTYSSQATDLVEPAAPSNLDQVYRQKL